MQYYIISGFPGVGKTYTYNYLNDYIKRNKLNWYVSDTDSSEYSHSKTPGGLRISNSKFPNNYIEAIINMLNIANNCKYDKCIIFVSSHDIVRKALDDSKLKVILVYPPLGSKEIYIQRYKNRNSPEPLIRKIDDNFDLWVKEIKDENRYNFEYKELTNDKYMNSIIHYIINNEGADYIG